MNPFSGDNVGYQRLPIIVHDAHYSYAEHAVDKHGEDETLETVFVDLPQFVGSFVVALVGVALQLSYPLGWQHTCHDVVGRLSQTYHIRCRECREYRNCHDYGVKVVACHVQRRAKCGKYKANSPICVSENEHCIEVFSDWPESRNPKVLSMV